MQTQGVEEVGCVFKRVKKGRRRKSFDFERVKAIKKPGPNGIVLLTPLPAAPPADPVPAPAKYVTVQAAKPKVPPAPKIPRNTNGSAQWSKLIVGMGKQSCVGADF